MHSLPIFLKLTGRPVILIGDGEALDAKRRLLERAGAKIAGEDSNARVAIVATADDQAAQDIVARLKARGILVNAADRPALCDFTLPAIVDRDPVVVAIGTGGSSAGLAKALRIAIEALLPPALGKLARTLADLRDRIRARWPDGDERRRAIDSALAPGGPLDPLSGVGGVAVERWIATSGNASASTTETILLRSPDPDDLTLREARLLGRADRILHGPDIPRAILDRARADAVRMVVDVLPEPRPPGLTLLVKWKE